MYEAPAGTDIQAAAETEMAAADYVLCLVTSHLFKDDTPWFGLLITALNNGKRVIPIRIEKSDIDGTGLEKLKALPTMNRSVSDFPNSDAAYTDIVTEIKKLVPK